MTDTLLRLANDRRTARLVRLLGLPAPVVLDRARAGCQERELAGRTLLLGAAAGSSLHGVVAATLATAGAQVAALPPAEADPGGALQGLVFDATGLRTPEDYRQLHDFFQPVLRRLSRNPRLVLLGEAPELREDPVAAAAARGLEGFARALGKEAGKRGGTVNLVLSGTRDPQALALALPGPLEFLCSARCTYVSGQVFRIGLPVPGTVLPQGEQRLAGRVALVTGAARGIGAATATRLAEEGAQVVCLDIAADRDGLYETASRVGGVPFTADVADAATPAALADFLATKFGGVDVVVHNAGITRDKTLANMPGAWWDQVLAINLRAILAIDQVLLARGLLRDGGRLLCLSSMGGIAGNYGQTNYAATKAALIGYVAAQAPRLAARGITANAVAPGFIETRMTAAMPWLPREVGRRMCSLGQGGQPRDVAELITFLASPAAGGISGNTLRVCGQGWLGA